MCLVFFLLLLYNIVVVILTMKSTYSLYKVIKGLIFESTEYFHISIHQISFFYTHDRTY